MHTMYINSLCVLIVAGAYQPAHAMTKLRSLATTGTRKIQSPLTQQKALTKPTTSSTFWEWLWKKQPESAMVKQPAPTQKPWNIFSWLTWNKPYAIRPIPMAPQPHTDMLTTLATPSEKKADDAMFANLEPIATLYNNLEALDAAFALIQRQYVEQHPAEFDRVYGQELTQLNSTLKHLQQKIDSLKKNNVALPQHTQELSKVTCDQLTRTLSTIKYANKAYNMLYGYFNREKKDSIPNESIFKEISNTIKGVFRMEDLTSWQKVRTAYRKFMSTAQQYISLMIENHREKTHTQTAGNQPPLQEEISGIDALACVQHTKETAKANINGMRIALKESTNKLAAPAEIKQAHNTLGVTEKDSFETIQQKYREQSQSLIKQIDALYKSTYAQSSSKTKIEDL